MNPLPDRTVILGMLITLGIVFGLVFWFVRLAPSTEPALQWRDGTPPAPLQRSLPGDGRGDLI